MSIKKKKNCLELLSVLLLPRRALTDVLNCLQGFFVFVIFVANRNKRKHLKEKFVLPFKAASKLAGVLRKVKNALLCQDAFSISPVSNITSRVTRKISGTSIISSLSTLSTSFKPRSTTSFYVTSPSEEHQVRRSSASGDESETGVVILSHSSLKLSASVGSETSC